MYHLFLILADLVTNPHLTHKVLSLNFSAFIFFLISKCTEKNILFAHNFVFLSGLSERIHDLLGLDNRGASVIALWAL